MVRGPTIQTCLFIGQRKKIGKLQKILLAVEEENGDCYLTAKDNQEAVEGEEKRSADNCVCDILDQHCSPTDGQSQRNHYLLQN